ncbi:hypothetical protein [Actinophytocola algeriensis]|uniref:DUF4386 family protein n=1 Tax=Actinophytocola algeriensis TaxID=1768010 RepID=A0A7W7Q213_9PSEU|nr:hypothetical protein [Actinophytocola algeriensis]MBB4905373.1 hypothetical protein [Actinophytocola algeriensis]MBE1472942.1 hypothetical protein [Actinophytocola algeriensis]
MSTHHDTRFTGALLLTALTAMIAGAVIVVPSGMTLNPAEPAAALAAVAARPGLHLVELGLDVTGWLALTAGALTMAARALLPAGLLACAGLAGLLHDAGNLAVTQLAADADDPTVIAVAGAVLLTAKWSVNLAGLLWVAATATAVLQLPMTAGLRRAGVVVALSGLAAVVLPWTTGVDGPSAAQEQLGYALHLPVMVWYGVLALRDLRARSEVRG